jgi:hypothetical protein
VWAVLVVEALAAATALRGYLTAPSSVLQQPPQNTNNPEFCTTCFSLMHDTLAHRRSLGYRSGVSLGRKKPVHCKQLERRYNLVRIKCEKKVDRVRTRKTRPKTSERLTHVEAKRVGGKKCDDLFEHRALVF